MSEQIKEMSKVVTLEGIDYTLQKLPAREALKLRKGWQDRNGNVDEIAMYESLLKHVVVSPKVTIDDFEDIADLEELMVEASQFVYAKKN